MRTSYNKVGPSVHIPSKNLMACHAKAYQSATSVPHATLFCHVNMLSFHGRGYFLLSISAHPFYFVFMLRA
jgi:hypothetical protein